MLPRSTEIQPFVAPIRPSPLVPSNFPPGGTEVTPRFPRAPRVHQGPRVPRARRLTAVDSQVPNLESKSEYVPLANHRALYGSNTQPGLCTCTVATSFFQHMRKTSPTTRGGWLTGLDVHLPSSHGQCDPMGGFSPAHQVYDPMIVTQPEGFYSLYPTSQNML